MNSRGNSFNTLFHNGRGTFYLASHLIKYLRDSKHTLNYTQNFILTCLLDSKILSICRALGIICEIITEPYWNVASDMDLSPFEMG